MPQALPTQDIWLTCFWSFEPDQWGCLGFTREFHLEFFLRRTSPGAIVAIYIAKNKGPETERGKLVGFYELSHYLGPDQDFVAPDVWAEKESHLASRGRWRHALKATRAWRIIDEDQRRIDDVLPLTYGRHSKQHIGAQGVRIEHEDISNILDLRLIEVPVYKQERTLHPHQQRVLDILTFAG